MIIRTNEKATALPAILEILPEPYTAWLSHGTCIIYAKDVEIATIPVAGLSPEEAAAKVQKELEGVI